MRKAVVLLTLAAAALTSVRAAAQAPAGTVLEETVPPGRNYDKAEFRLWLPTGVEAVQAIAVLVPGSNGDGRGQVDDPVWQNFAVRHKLALVGVRLTDKPHDQGFIEEYVNVSQGGILVASYALAVSGSSSFVMICTAFAASFAETATGATADAFASADGASAFSSFLLTQSDSKVSISFFTTFASRTIRPSSRRESSSAVRRLWLPTKAWCRSRMIVRVCSRMPASFCTSNPARPATEPMTLISTPAFARSCRMRSISWSEIFGS